MFLAHTNLFTITDELEDVRTDISFLISGEETNINNLRDRERALRAFHISILQNPLSGSTIPAVCSGWEALKALDLDERQTSLLLRGQRSCIMLTNYLAWYWLDVCVQDACISIMEKTPMECQWLVQLVQDVQEVYKMKIPQRQFSSSSYGITIPGGTATFHFHNQRTYALRGSAFHDDVSDVSSAVDSILRHWLDYPPPDQGRTQALLVHVLVKIFGRPVLYLNSIWKTYTGARRRSIDTQHWRVTSFKDVNPLTEAAAKHPLSKDSSPESIALQELARLLERYLEGNLDITSERRQGGSNIEQIPSQLQCLSERKIKVFTTFVMDCLSLFLRQGEVNGRLKETMDSKPDKIMPFREHAPSRLRIRGPDGPFSANYARTTTGAYSAVVWRGVTFATPFSMNDRMIFTSYDDFQLACREAGQHESGYFCDPGAYGRINVNREVKLAEEYWKSLADGKWTKLVQNRIVPFTECYQFFTARPTRFSQLGPLASYLLTADFSYCSPKVVESPNLSEMASIICSVNKGAIAGLESLGFLAPRPKKDGKKRGKAYLEKCEMALERAHDLLTNIIPAEHQKTINLDFIMTEHTLCKFSRAINWKIIERL